MKYDLIVVGSGPGGYVAAIRASQLGMKVACVEKESVGGICLNWGCIPTKALLKSAQVFNYINHAEDYGIEIKSPKANFEKVIKRSRDVADGMSKGVNFLFRKNKIDLINGFGTLLRGKKVQVDDAEGNSKIYEADHIIVATGARAKSLPNLPIDNENIIDYRKAMSMDKLPKRMVVVGAGAIGVEFAYFYHSLGTEVTVIEYMKQGLVPREDKDVSRELNKIFKKRGINVLADTAVLEVNKKGGHLEVSYQKNGSDKKEMMACDVVLSAVGVVPNTSGIGLETVGVKTNKHGQIEVNSYCETNVSGIYAIGDCIPGPALAHVASAEGILCVEKIKGLHVEPINYNNIPSCTYCKPEVASVGYTESQAKEAGFELRVGKFPFSASGKASASGSKEGFVKVIYDKKYGELLGAHFIGDNVTEMIAEIVAARKLETTGHEIIKAIHPHPTMSEAVMEASAAAYDEVIHL